MSTRVTRRTFMEGGIGFTVANFLPGMGFAPALAATPEERIVAAAKPLGAAAISGMLNILRLSSPDKIRSWVCCSQVILVRTSPLISRSANVPLKIIVHRS